METFFHEADRQPRTVAFALCGSFCPFEKVLPVMQTLVQAGWQVLPVLSFNAAGQNTRFGEAEQWQQRLYAATGHYPLQTLQQVEPLGPRRMADALVVAPCTGTTLAKLALGLSDTPVTLAAKSLLRNGRPVVLALSTNDGLGASAQHIAALLNRKHYYFEPFAQDDPLHKPQSLQAEFTLLPDVLELALQAKQYQPVLLS